MRAMQLKEEITLIKRKNCSILEYLHAVKALADKITLIDHPISDDDLNFYILNGLSFDFKDITASIRQICWFQILMIFITHILNMILLVYPIEEKQ